MIGSFVTSLLSYGPKTASGNVGSNGIAKSWMLQRSAVQLVVVSMYLKACRRSQQISTTRLCIRPRRVPSCSPVSLHSLEVSSLWPIFTLMCSMMQAMQCSASNMSPVAVPPAAPNSDVPCPNDDFMTQTLGDCSARWKAVVAP